jgi:hypothetical protein
MGGVLTSRWTRWVRLGAGLALTCCTALRGDGGNVEGKQNMNWLYACLLMVLAVGCSSQAVRGPVDARAAGGLDVRAGRTLVPSDLALGGDVALASRSERSSTADIDAYLKPQPAAPARPPTRKRAPEPAAPALPPPPALAPEAEALAQTEQSAQQPALVASATLGGGDLERYAQREQRSRNIQGYRGGDAIVITSSALIIALLIVLLIVLLT